VIASVDGCKGGWVVAMSTGWPCEGLSGLFVCRDFRSVIAATERCGVVVVDMPVGIPSGSELRKCDIAAREALGPAGRSRVFLTPPRGCLKAETPEEFQRMHREVRGKGAALVVWGIVPKIREVDAVMRPELQERIVEFHPELVWKHLSGKVLESKHKQYGVAQRAELFKGGVRDINGLQMPAVPNGAKMDDVLDAAVGLWTADCIVGGGDYNRRLPKEEPARDERGLRMEIWF
jgi:predicted RNase H-like nuclease